MFALRWLTGWQAFFSAFAFKFISLLFIKITALFIMFINLFINEFYEGKTKEKKTKLWQQQSSYSVFVQLLQILAIDLDCINLL